MPWPTILPFPNPISVHNTISKCKIIAAQPRVDFNVVLDFTLSQRGERADRVQLVPILYYNITTMLSSTGPLFILQYYNHAHFFLNNTYSIFGEKKALEKERHGLEVT